MGGREWVDGWVGEWVGESGWMGGWPLVDDDVPDNNNSTNNKLTSIYHQTDTKLTSN